MPVDRRNIQFSSLEMLEKQITGHSPLILCFKMCQHKENEPFAF